jgi:Ca2+-binding RTX toxin-like protein
MSAVLTPIALEDSIQPEANSKSQAADGESFAVSDPRATGGTPATIEVNGSGTVFVAPATENAGVVINGEGTATLDLSNATLKGDIQATGGSAVQVDEDYQGEVIADFSNAIVTDDEGNPTEVDLTISTGDGSSIADNAPTGASGINFYVNVGAANDKIQGTSGNDFIRGGAGNDVINAGAGDDIVRGGAGSDTVTLGEGEDVYYFTVDQLQGESNDTITDFESGVDQIQFDADLEGRVEITGQGTGKIVITLSGTETGTTTVTSNGDDIQDDDIQFV